MNSVSAGGAGVGLAEKGVDLEEILHRIRAADGVGLAGIGVGLAPVYADGVNGLEPEPVDAEVLDIGQIEAVSHRVVRPRAGAAVEVGEGAALVIIGALRADVHRVQLVEGDVAGLGGRDDDGVVAAAIARIPEPVGVAGHLVARRQTIGAGLLRVKREGVLAGRPAGGHGVSLVIVAVVAGCNGVAVRRHDAVFDAVAVGIAWWRGRGG